VSEGASSLHTRPAPFVGSEFPDREFEELCRFLRDTQGFDLGLYKDRCIKRRIAIRVRALGLDNAADYLRVLHRDAAEAEALLSALTIHVSQFFRNPSTFALLEKQVLPELFRRAGSGGRGRLRLWSVGCAGGEEPYSLALLCNDLTVAGVSVSILGTDVSAKILDQARKGIFEAQRLVEVSPGVRERYFSLEGRHYRLAEHVRNLVMFKQHNIMASQEYPRTDFIMCRNVLIYFSRAEQERILARFAGALPAGGILVLGRSETLLGESRELFDVESLSERIYRRRES